jgi:DNA-binding transcriptional regulator GbsR (MarR family)
MSEVMNVQGKSSQGEQLSPVETEVVDLFMHLAQILGAPKSLGAIYGLLFISPEPINFDDVMKRLHLSAGSVSHGLKALRAWGAARTQFVSGDRRDFFVAETRLRQLVAGFLRESVEGHLISGGERLESLSDLVNEEPGLHRDFLRDRVQTLSNWHKQARNILPALLQVMETPTHP